MVKRFLAVGILCLSLTTLPSEADVTVNIHVDKPASKINRNIYGQFMEHLGRGIYEGIWVGENSEIPNTNGYRNDVLAALKELQVPLLRWPGGCFADEYHWQDGIGPKEERAKRVNTTWGGVIDDNRFGTHEFLDLAEMLNAEVYVNGNLGTGTPTEMAQWLEYMTSDSDSTLANQRRANGRDKPWRIDHFAIGNEAWGCGGNMTPEYYTDLYKHYATFAKTPHDNTPLFIASGGQNAQTDWTETLIKAKKTGVKMDAISHHYYTLPTGDWGKKGAALDFPESEWLSTMVNTVKIEKFLMDNIAIMDKYDPEAKVAFNVDEWGTWFDVSEGEPGFLYQQNSLRDAIVAAVNLNIFHKYAKRVQMSNIAQMINVLQAMILTDKEKMLLTPTYHVFKMHVPFQDASYLPLTLKNNGKYGEGENSVDKISASAAVTKTGEQWLTLVNLDPNKAETIRLDGKYQGVKGQILTDVKMDAHNTFDKPNNLAPRQFEVKASNDNFAFELPAKSVIVVKLNN
ncbi:alpha-N-arabinofuranosidase [Paraglaciecola aquimarina]|uniref:non-reducing end alpha-L-arabinofuranosidase n=1 Tax=Paraglaciecola algarum TaxID=3050085 RepID=A0ABS9DC68_9ALTE|nr:alpha-L-arabinofuranosidase C-terminal domain-containing protein [Paraglaciecola sp. G1-23]MCF2949613.1 alpha-N-arabinofuranosidase [Paraglaciecola sp. G1-23]